MRKEYADSKLKFYIGNVRDPSSLRDAMALFSPRRARRT